MKLAKIRSVELDQALRSKRFPVLGIYLRSFRRTEDGCFISPLNTFTGEWDILDTLSDYICNEPESALLLKETTINYLVIKMVIL